MKSVYSKKVISVGKKRPIVCPVCKFVLRDEDDVRSVDEDGACSECTINFKHLYIEKWKKGWRPSVDEARSKITHI